MSRILALGFIDPAILAWQAAGGSVTAGRLALMSNLVVTLKSASVWPLLDRLWLFANQNTTSALLDLVNLQTATPGGSPTFTADQGYQASVVPAYVNTNFNPSTGTPHYVLNSAHFGFYNRTNQAANASVEMGDSVSGGNDYETNVSVKWSDGNNYFALNDANGDAGRAGPTNTSGIWVISRTGSTTATVYQAGSSLGSNGQASAFIPSLAFLVGNSFDHTGGFNASSVASTCQFGMASIGAGFSAQNVTDFTNAIQTYMTAIGA